jgi:hypothetical protein
MRRVAAIKVTRGGTLKLKFEVDSKLFHRKHTQFKPLS